jgi:hypothetical protein
MYPAVPGVSDTLENWYKKRTGSQPDGAVEVLIITVSEEVPYQVRGASAIPVVIYL